MNPDLCVTLVAIRYQDVILPKGLYLKKCYEGDTRADGLVAMTEAFQALNPGSNPGRRTSPFFCFFTPQQFFYSLESYFQVWEIVQLQKYLNDWNYTQGPNPSRECRNTE